MLDRNWASLFATLFLTTSLCAQTWPQYHGPDGSRRVTGAIDAQQLDAADNAPLWVVPTTKGFSSFVVHDGRAYTLEARSDQECCVARDAKTGTELWVRELGKVKYDGGGDAGTPDNSGGDGPRSTPSCDADRVYVFDAQLVLHCLDAKDGSVVFQKDLVADHGAVNIRWQNAASPLVEGRAVFVAGGGPGASLLAFDKKSGDLLWKGHDEKITHATPIAATLHGERQVIFYTQAGLVAVRPDNGELRWRASYPFQISSAASPIVDGSLVYVSAGYGVGAAVFEVLRDDEGAFDVQLLWRKPNKLMNHWSTPLVKDGHLYGMFSFKKYGKGPLACVDLRSGETRWSQEGFGPGNCILVGTTLVALSDKGEVVLADASPEGYHELARRDVLKGKCWSQPAFADGKLYVRSTSEGACIALTAPAKPVKNEGR